MIFQKWQQPHKHISHILQHLLRSSIRPDGFQCTVGCPPSHIALVCAEITEQVFPETKSHWVLQFFSKLSITRFSSIRKWKHIFSEFLFTSVMLVNRILLTYMFLSKCALVSLFLSQHVWAVLLYFSFVVCPFFHFLCALHFSSLRTSLLSQVGLLPKFPVFLNNGLNKWCVLISRKLALGKELSVTGGMGGGGWGWRNVLPISFLRK